MCFFFWKLLGSSFCGEMWLVIIGIVVVIATYLYKRNTRWGKDEFHFF